METKVNIDEDLTTLAISNGDYPVDFVRKLADLQKNKRLTDITLRIDNEEIVAHKAILAAASPFFNNLFDDDFIKSKKNVVDLQHRTTPEIMSSIIDYIYSGKLTVKEKDLDLFFENIDHLGMENLKKKSGQALSTLLNSTNCVQIFILADKHQLLDVRTKAASTLSSNYSSILNSTDIKTLSIEDVLRNKMGNLRFTATFSFQLEVILEIVHKSQVKNTLVTIIEWIKDDDSNRQQHMFSLTQKYVDVQKLTGVRRMSSPTSTYSTLACKGAFR
ncbi:speckle-type POZ protein B-like isoform X4 [Hermetia illucens]|uniref:speckle-type POZ protein B-like isoform X4 n=1 Tax=Hermetia illucens TaxID=343691 RepID=UPI0018CC6D67|nr:speckle-type POZ protein B-like isoform X4 [Hermetia illucens]